MVKINKTINIDFNVNEELKARNVNVSKLVNDYLQSYLGIDDTSSSEYSELKSEYDKSLAKTNKIKARLEEAKKIKEEEESGWI